MATALDELPAAWTVVHDRLLRPGRSEANLDHIIIGPAGVFLVDAKNRAGTVAEHDGGLFQHRTRHGVRETVSLAAELKKVHGMAAYMAAESDVRVEPVLCLAGAQEKGFGEPRMVRGVWVVPVSAVAGWLRSRPVVLGADEVARTTTRVITDFPSTTTDPGLLAAMGQAATLRQSARRHVARRPGRPARAAAPRSARPPQHQWLRRLISVVGRLALVGLGIALVFGVIERLPHLLGSLAHIAEPEASGGVGEAPTPGGTEATTAAAKKPVPKPLGPPDCADASAAEIKAIIGRTVRPVAVSRGCAWGTRLDDPSTVVVTIVMTDGHAAYRTALVTSAKQNRVVFGGGSDPNFRPATTASVASGELIVRGSKPVKARADTVVEVATHSLRLSDDRARKLAVAIAAAANSG